MGSEVVKTEAAVVEVKERKSPLDLSDLPVAERARLQRLRAEVMIQRGLRDQADWLSKNGGLSKNQTAAGAAIAMEVGSNLGFALGVARTAVIVINGTPSVYGDSALALIRASGLVDPKKGGYIKWSYTGTKNDDGTVGDDYTAHVSARRADTGEELECSFSVREAKRAGLWGGDIWRAWGALRMLRYRALGFLVRDLFSDVTKGLHLREELVGGPDDVGGGAPAPRAMTPTPAPGAGPVDPLWEPESAPNEPGHPPAGASAEVSPDAPTVPVEVMVIKTTAGPVVLAPEPGVREASADEYARVEPQELVLVPPDVVEASATVRPTPTARAVAPDAVGDVIERRNGSTIEKVRVLERDDAGKPLVVQRVASDVPLPKSADPDVAKLRAAVDAAKARTRAAGGAKKAVDF